MLMPDSGRPERDWTRHDTHRIELTDQPGAAIAIVPIQAAADRSTGNASGGTPTQVTN
jgi:hypothetical protein